VLGINILKSITATYEHRLEGIGHPVCSAIHKPQSHLDSSASRHSVEFQLLAALKGEAKVSIG
jgi:hypothetical protein